ncbi:para-nitrobenzyl esterase-like [Ptychodera flava]|uniref:para-nitrobenzyl esterase-like n=1 Tax=Ptychodera flava TaxID=63121 RepID=UPI00396A2BE3
MSTRITIIVALSLTCATGLITTHVATGEDLDEQITDEAKSWQSDSLRVRSSYVETDCGPIAGRSTRGVHVFKGIPYAKPPINDLRWKPPVSLKASGSCWSGTLQALDFAPVCFQKPKRTGPGIIRSEDCLYLNVYTPSLDTSANLPVMVWIHGGGLMISGSSMAGYHPNVTTVIDTGMVYVSFNYRLNGFGFLALDILSEQSETHTSGNYGFMDQILVLEWVRDNIKHFGGNPDLVTLFGHSAGASSVMALSVSPLAEGLFHRAWMSSAAPYFQKTLEEASKDNLVFLERSHCRDIECIYSLTPEEVLRAIPTDVYPYWGELSCPDVPVKGLLSGGLCIVDGVVVPLDPLTAWKEGKAADIPLVIGATAQEYDSLPLSTDIRNWSWAQYESDVAENLDTFGKDITVQALSLYPYDKTKDTPELIYTTMASDVRFTCGSSLIAEHAALSLKSPVYRYVSTWWPSEPFSDFEPPWKPRYAFHASDVYAFFGFIPYYIPNPTKEDMQFQALMQQAIVYFAKKGVMPPEFNWLNAPDSVALIGNEMVIQEDYHKKECKFWMNNGFYRYSVML